MEGKGVLFVRICCWLRVEPDYASRMQEAALTDDDCPRETERLANPHLAMVWSNDSGRWR